MKKTVSILVLLLVLVMTLNCFAADVKMTDVDYTSDLGKSIDKLVKGGVISGIPQDDGTYTYAPQKHVTRAEFCKMVNVTFGFEIAADNIFKDVNPYQWYYIHVLPAIHYGYIQGYGDGRFGGDDYITREQVCRILNTIVNKTSETKVEIKDKVSDWAKADVENFIGLGYISLEEGGKFRATENMTRGELAFVLDDFVVIEEAKPENLDMCAQHNNGGFAVNMNYESTTLGHFFIVGEAAGVFGIHRPGGSALNSTQVGSCAAAEKILEYTRSGAEIPTISSISLPLLAQTDGTLTRADILAKRQEYAAKMTECGAFIRDEAKIRALIPALKAELAGFGSYRTDASLLGELAINRDILVTQITYLSAILEYMRDGGKSRGSYLIVRGESALPTGRDAIDIDREHFTKACAVCWNGGNICFDWQDVRPIPTRDNWFENVYNAFRKRMM